MMEVQPARLTPKSHKQQLQALMDLISEFESVYANDPRLARKQRDRAYLRERSLRLRPLEERGKGPKPRRMPTPMTPEQAYHNPLLDMVDREGTPQPDMQETFARAMFLHPQYTMDEKATLMSKLKRSLRALEHVDIDPRDSFIANPAVQDLEMAMLKREVEQQDV